MALRKRSSFPSRLVSLAVGTRLRIDPCKPVEETREPTLIVSRHSRIEAGKNGRIQTGTFSTGTEWAEWLGERLRYEGVTWIVAHRLGDILRTIGFFQMVDERSFYLVPPGETATHFDDVDKTVRPTAPLALMEDSPTAIKAFTSAGQKLLLCDLRNWLDCSLDDLAKTIGIERRTVGINDRFSRSGIDDLTTDLEIQERSFLDYLAWLKSRGIRDFRLTAGSQALQYFKQRHRAIAPTPDAEPEVRSWERAAFWGGKVEAKYIGHLKVNGSRGLETHGPAPATAQEETPGELYHLDATSLYGCLMLKREFPHRLIEWSEEPNEPWIGPPYWGRDLLASVDLATEHDTYPVKDGRRTLWATGRFRTTLPGPELARAVRKGHVAGWGVYARYQMAPMFGSYVMELWKLRQHARETGNPMFERVAKTLINSLWGKFGAKSPRWTETDDPGFGEDWGVFHHVDGTSGQIKRYRALGGVYQVEDKPEDTPDSYPAISAWLTSYGRCYLDDAVRVAGEGNVFYTAVDALVTNELGFLSLCEAGAVEPNALGKLRVTGVHRAGRFGGYNRYWLDGVSHASGLAANAQEIADGIYVQTDHGRLVPALLAGERDRLVVRNRIVDFQRNVIYGKVDKWGWVTPPVVETIPF